MNNVTTIGIDLAKEVFQVHGADRTGKEVYSKKLKRKEVMRFLEQQTPCLIGIEACCGAYYWARQFKKAGHEVKIMAPQFVKPYVRADKTDKNDARAIAEAVRRPDMHFVPQKSIEQQDLQLLHRIRELAVKQRSALSNQLRGLLAEYGIVLAKGFAKLRSQLPCIIEDGENELSYKARGLFQGLYEEFKKLDERIAEYDKQLAEEAKTDERCKRLLEIEGIGVISATALVASIADVSVFKNGRQLSAWLGLVPKQHSSGGKVKLQGISKRGDSYLRRLLIHGGRAVVKTLKAKEDKRSEWARQLVERAGVNKAAVAIANKNARIVWAMLHRDEKYRATISSDC